MLIDTGEPKHMTEQTTDHLDDILRGRSRDYIQSIMTPDNPYDRNALSEEQRIERAEILNELYTDKGLSLAKVSDIVGLSRQRIKEIMVKHGYKMRPALGTKTWRENKTKSLAASE